MGKALEENTKENLTSLKTITEDNNEKIIENTVNSNKSALALSLDWMSKRMDSEFQAPRLSNLWGPAFRHRTSEQGHRRDCGRTTISITWFSISLSISITTIASVSTITSIGSSITISSITTITISWLSISFSFSLSISITTIASISTIASIRSSIAITSITISWLSFSLSLSITIASIASVTTIASI